VEAEVERRLKEKLEEMDRQRAADEERTRQESEIADTTRDQTFEIPQPSLPSGLLTPLLKRHQDLDNELRQRLHELEKKYERDKLDGDIVQKLSPKSRKKTGRAYVALARSHSEKGDLQVALDLYRKAESYVPDNMKLKERIIEIESAVTHGSEFHLSPRRPKPRRRTRRATQARAAQSGTLNTVPEMSVPGDESHEEEAVMSLLGGDPKDDLRKQGSRVAFGVEVTNSPSKRGMGAAAYGNGEVLTTFPLKLASR